MNFDLITNTMGADVQFGHVCQTGPAGFVVFRTVGKLSWETPVANLQVVKINIVLFRSLNKKYFRNLEMFFAFTFSDHAIFSYFKYSSAFLSFSVWVQRGEDVLKVFPEASKQHVSSSPLMFISLEPSILLCGCLIHVSPKMTLFSGVRHSYVSVVMECTLFRLWSDVRFLRLNPVWVYRIDVRRVCRQIETTNKNKLRPGPERATLMCPLCSRSAEMKPSALSLYISLMLWCTQPFIISRSLNC